MPNSADVYNAKLIAFIELRPFSQADVKAMMVMYCILTFFLIIFIEHVLTSKNVEFCFTGLTGC